MPLTRAGSIDPEEAAHVHCGIGSWAAGVRVLCRGAGGPGATKAETAPPEDARRRILMLAIL